MPDGAGYTGSVEDFTQANIDVVNSKEAVEGELQVLWNAMANLESMWKGPAHDAFMAMMRRFDEDSKNLNQALEGIAEQLKAAGSTYQESEQSQMDVFGNLASQLDG
jgi:WXG100 family type VII secretion target